MTIAQFHSAKDTVPDHDVTQVDQIGLACILAFEHHDAFPTFFARDDLVLSTR